MQTAYSFSSFLQSKKISPRGWSDSEWPWYISNTERRNYSNTSGEERKEGVKRGVVFFYQKKTLFKKGLVVYAFPTKIIDHMATLEYKKR